MNSQQANAERAIPFSLPRGHQLIVTAYTANYLLPVALYDIWFVFAGSGASVLGGKPVASWFDPQALSPIKTS